MPVSRDLRILIVDDRKVMRQVLADVLRAVDFRNIHFADNGRAALDLMTAEKEPFGLVLLDWDMPVMNGLQLLEAMRNDPRLATVPVIMVTVEAFSDKVLRAVQAGVTDYIVKPYTPDTIYKKIGQLLGEEL